MVFIQRITASYVVTNIAGKVLVRESVITKIPNPKIKVKKGRISRLETKNNPGN
jgi:hypothetical protein